MKDFEKGRKKCEAWIGKVKEVEEAEELSENEGI